MSKENGRNFCIVDHANKLADRERINPNRGRQRWLRAWDKSSGKSTTVEIPDWLEAAPVAKESVDLD
jgi:hypothetical protein